MAGITQAMSTSFKVEILEAVHNFSNPGGNTFKIALFKSGVTGTYDATTTNYSEMTGNTDEVTGTGYVAGGNTLAAVTPTSGGTTAFTDFADTTWTTATITASGAMIYNSSASDAAVCVLNFGGDKTSTAGDFTIIFPTASASDAIIRIA